MATQSINGVLGRIYAAQPHSQIAVYRTDEPDTFITMFDAVSTSTMGMNQADLIGCYDKTMDSDSVIQEIKDNA